jgi:predicted glycogen debranching enzyme
MRPTDLEFHYIKDEELTLSKALSLEWLDTNGLGSYASSTITNAHTRKYHGLLVSDILLPESSGKYVLLSKLEDVLTIDDKEYSLCATQYPGAFSGGGYDLLKEFVCDTHPCFVYCIDDVVIIKEIILIYQQATVLIKYKILSEHKKPNFTLRLRPFFAYRSFHGLTHVNEDVQLDTLSCIDGRRVSPYEGMPPMFLQVSEMHDFIVDPHWYNNFEYKMEQERGFDAHEDLCSPGVFEIPVAAREIIFSASLHELNDNYFRLWDSEITRRQKVIDKTFGSQLQKRLQFVAKTFIKKTSISLWSIVAGYHWFASWGRDSMISLPGLTLCNKDYQTCIDILRTYAEKEEDGLIPNYIKIGSEKDAYNTVDASLWFVWAVQQYCLATNDLVSIKKYFWQTLLNIFNNYKNGTLYSISMHDNGLIYADSQEYNLTWMDAMVNGRPVTPRSGAQVEVNALWFNGLCFIHELAKKFSHPVCEELKLLIKQVQKTFIETFWDENLGFLKDFVNDKEQNCALRPNQIFAISLPYAVIPKTYAKKILDRVCLELLTPYGLRTLAPSDPNYIGSYAGGPEERDRAYHNGTVWPWLVGHFGEALIKTYSKGRARKILNPCFEALVKHMHEAGIGTISEIFSGDSPHAPNGCISQAWSVAELLRLSSLLGRF